MQKRPELPPLTLCLLFAAALFGGFIDTLAGSSGGLITLPALLAAGLPPHPALGHLLHNTGGMPVSPFTTCGYRGAIEAGR